MNRKAFISGASIAVVVAIVVGLLTIGGPNKARREMFDMRRYEDLAKISSALNCPNWRVRQPTLPNDLNLATIRAYCGGVEIQAEQLLDNETGKPYLYVRTSEDEYTVCAEFFDAERAMRLSYRRFSGSSTSFNPATGCVTGRVY